MKKLNKKVVISLLGAALMVAAVGATSVSAESVTGGTELGYNHGNVVPENPAHPENSNWAVSIPTNVEFTAEKEIRNMDIELKAINNHSLNELTKKINVTVESGHKGTDKEWKLASTVGSSTIEYSLTYNGKTNGAIGTLELSKDVAKITGTVTLGEDKDADLVRHTDILTYNIEQAPDAPVNS